MGLDEQPGRMNYVFGPVPSRRLGQSLGIDTIPLKTCNWNCVYCQLGRTRPLNNKRRDYYPPEAILAEVQRALEVHPPGEIDWLTFVGSGEPLLHASAGWLIRMVKDISQLPVAVITNGSLFYQPQVRQEVAAADAVLPSLDAGSPERYRQVNRPHPEVTFERHVSGLIDLRQEYHGCLWVEVMLVRGLNDSAEALREIALWLGKIQPDRVHINLPTRPPVETWVEPADDEGLLRAQAIFGEIAEVVHPADGSYDVGGEVDILEAILAIIGRHPMRQMEIERTLDRWSPGQISQGLAELADSGRAQPVERFGMRFWCSAAGFYPDEPHSQRTFPDGPAHQRQG